MERVQGIGGYFLRAKEPEVLLAWYRDQLGVALDEHGLWHQPAGPSVFATFAADSDYFGARSQQSMLNFRVQDLEAMLAQLRRCDTPIEGPEEMAGVGRFAWVRDPEGNRIELWQLA